jgi:nucleoid DNA-binding protein
MAKIQAKKTKNKASAPKKLVKTPKKTLKIAPGKAPKNPPLVVKEAFNNRLLIKTLVERTHVRKKDVLSVLEGLKEIIVAHLVKKGPQKFKWQGVLMAKIKDKPATKARKGINPFNGEEMIFAAKPARRTVKITAIKKFKDLL